MAAASGAWPRHAESPLLWPSGQRPALEREVFRSGRE